MACIPPTGHEDALDGVHVRDHGVQGQRLVRRDAGVHRLEAEDALQPLVVEERGHLAAEPAEPAEADQAGAGPPAAHEVERRVEVGVDEVRHLDPVQLGQPVGEAPERGRRGRRRRTRRISSVIASRPWRTWSTEPSANDGAVHRVDRAQLDVVGHVGAGGGEHVGEQPGHRQHGRAVVEPEPVALDDAGPAARAVAALDDRDVVAVADEVGGGGQPAEAGADDDDAASALSPRGRRRRRPARRARRGPPSVMATRSRAATASAASAEMCASSASRAPVSTMTCWIVATSSSPRSGAPTRASTSSSAGSASATARASSGVGLPSRRSSPTGLPVTAGVAERADHVVAHLEGVAERQAVGAQRGQQRRRRASGDGEHRAEVQRALDRVLAALVAGDALGLGEAPLALHGAEDVEVLADVELDAQLVPQRPHLGRRAGQQLVGEHEGEVADEDRHALAEAARLAGPRRAPVRRRRRRRASSARRGGSPSRPSRRRGTGRRRASARTPRRRGRPARRRGRRRRRRSPSGRTPAAGACRRSAPCGGSRRTARRGRRRTPPSGRAPSPSRSSRQRVDPGGDGRQGRRRGRRHPPRLRASRAANLDRRHAGGGPIEPLTRCSAPIAGG